MASNLLSTAFLLSLVAIAAASAGVGDECRPGLSFPHNPLATCRTYVVSRACRRGPRLPALVKERCCRELSAVPELCRCAALRVLVDGVPTAEGGVVEGRLGDLRDCPREKQRGFAGTLMTAAECNLRTVSGGTECYWLLLDGVPKH